MVIRYDKSEKDNKKLDVTTRIIYIVHMHAMLNMPKKQWLTGDRMVMYMKMLSDFVDVVDMNKRGWIRTVSKSKYRYQDLLTIKKFGWFKKEGKKYVFPESLVEAVRNIKNGVPVEFCINV